MTEKRINLAKRKLAGSTLISLLNRAGFAGGHFRPWVFVQPGVIPLSGFGWRYVSDFLQEPSGLNQSARSKGSNSTASKFLQARADG